MPKNYKSSRQFYQFYFHQEKQGNRQHREEVARGEGLDDGHDGEEAGHFSGPGIAARMWQAGLQESGHHEDRRGFGGTGVQAVDDGCRVG